MEDENVLYDLDANSDELSENKHASDKQTTEITSDKSFFKQSDTITSTTTKTSSKSSKKKVKRDKKPTWNRYNFHLNDKQREKLMELPAIPKTVRLENKAILKRRSRSAKANSSSKLQAEQTNNSQTKKMLKSIIKKSPSSSRSVSVSSRAKSISRLDTDDESTNRKKSSSSARTRSQSNIDNYSDKEDLKTNSSKSNLPRRKIKFTSIRNTRRQNPEDIDEKINEINNGFDQMKVSKPYDRLLRSMRYNL